MKLKTSLESKVSINRDGWLIRQMQPTANPRCQNLWLEDAVSE